MITLHCVSKTTGKAHYRRSILENISWQIPARSQIAILGHPSSGPSILLAIIAGMTLPTTGWVERRATLSVPSGVLRYALRGTTRQLLIRLSRLYSVETSTLIDFVVAGLGKHVLDVPPALLPQRLKQQLNHILTLAIPYDFYLFQNSASVTGEPIFKAFCERALEIRRSQAGIIITSTSVKAARKLDHHMTGALLYKGGLTLYNNLRDAIAVFENLPPEHAPLTDNDADTTSSFESDDTLF